MTSTLAAWVSEQWSGDSIRERFSHSIPSQRKYERLSDRSSQRHIDVPQVALPVAGPVVGSVVLLILASDVR